MKSKPGASAHVSPTARISLPTSSHGCSPESNAAHVEREGTGPFFLGCIPRRADKSRGSMWVKGLKRHVRRTTTLWKVALVLAGTCVVGFAADQLAFRDR